MSSTAPFYLSRETDEPLKRPDKFITYALKGEGVIE
jgi:hypothetical protein